MSGSKRMERTRLPSLAVGLLVLLAVAAAAVANWREGDDAVREISAGIVAGSVVGAAIIVIEREIDERRAAREASRQEADARQRRELELDLELFRTVMRSLYEQRSIIRRWPPNRAKPGGKLEEWQSTAGAALLLAGGRAPAVYEAVNRWGESDEWTEIRRAGPNAGNDVHDREQELFNAVLIAVKDHLLLNEHAVQA